jgi:hypothetical protein
MGAILIQTNLFEYTSGCGAHANRKRPVAPAAPGHGSGSVQSSSQPQRKPPAPNSHVPQPKQVQQPRPAVQTRPEPIASTSGRPTSSIAEQLPPIENRMGGVHKQHNVSYKMHNDLITHILKVPNAHPFIAGTGIPQQSRKRPAPGPDEFNTPPPLRRPTPLSAARMPQVWQQQPQQQQQHAIYQQQQREPRAVEFAAAAQQQQHWHQQQQQQQFQPPSTRLLHATSVPRQAWPQPAHQQSRYMHNTGQVRVPIPPPASQVCGECAVLYKSILSSSSSTVLSRTAANFPLRTAVLSSPTTTDSPRHTSSSPPASSTTPAIER